MPKAVDINLDVTEMVLKLEKEKSPRTIEYSKIDRLEKVTESVKKWLRTVEVRGIKVTVKGMDEPIVITSDKLGDYDRIEEHLFKVAEKYDVTVE